MPAAVLAMVIEYTWEMDVISVFIEEKAIDGQLEYTSFPPAEYKYFSKIAILGYINRYKGVQISQQGNTGMLKLM